MISTRVFESWKTTLSGGGQGTLGGGTPHTPQTRQQRRDKTHQNQTTPGVSKHQASQCICHRHHTVHPHKKKQSNKTTKFVPGQPSFCRHHQQYRKVNKREKKNYDIEKKEEGTGRAGRVNRPPRQIIKKSTSKKGFKITHDLSRENVGNLP